MALSALLDTLLADLHITGCEFSGKPFEAPSQRITCRIADFLRQLDASVTVPSTSLLSSDTVACCFAHLFVPNQRHINGELQMSAKKTRISQ